MAQRRGLSGAVIATAMLLGALACSSSERPMEPPSAAQTIIAGGAQPAPIDTADAFSAVVRLRSPGIGVSPTGTLISCREILAGLNLYNKDAALAVDFVRYTNPSAQTVTTSVSLVTGVTYFPRALMSVHADTDSSKNIAVIRLPAPPVKGIRPLPLFAASSSSSLPGSQATLVGFGATADPPGSCPVPFFGVLHDRRVGTILTAGIQLGTPTSPKASGLALLWQRTAPGEASMNLDDAGAPLLVGSPPTVAALFGWHPLEFTPCDRTRMEFTPIAENRAWLNSVLLPPEPDDDNDGVPNSCDACALGDDGNLCPNGTLHAGKAKACEACGCDDVDTDKDGICDNEDGCPLVKSTLAVNTNSLSESVHAPTKLWPDVCDPVPTPALSPVVQPIPLSNPPCTVPFLCLVRRGFDNATVRATAVRSNRAANKATGPASVSLINVESAVRFCQNPLATADPICDEDAAIQDERLDDAPNADGEARAQPYHRIRIDVGGSALPRGATTRFDYVNAHAFDTKLQKDFRWQHIEDFTHWQAKAGSPNEVIPLPPTNPAFPEGSAASGLQGKLWVHAFTGAGHTSELGTGLHGEELANAHIDLTPEHYRFDTIGGPLIWPAFEGDKPYLWPLAADPKKRSWQPFPDQAAGQMRLAYWGGALGGPFVLSAGGDLFDASARVGPGLLAAMATNPVVLNSSEPFGAWWSANERAGVLLSSTATEVVDSFAIDDSGSLVGGADDRGVGCTAGQVLVRCGAGHRCAVPCNGIVGDDPSAPGVQDPTCTLAALPASDESTDEASFTCESVASGACSAGTMACGFSCFVPCDGNVGCAPDGRFGDEQPDLCGSALAGSTLALAANPGVPALPQPRVGFVGVYSRALDRVFVAGGRTQSGEALRDIWTGRPTGHFFRLGIDGELGEVLAATYHPTEHALYLVDQLSQAPAKSKGGGGSTFARLLRVDVFSGALVQLGAWVRLGVVHDRYFLVVDRDGSLLLVATSALAGKHVVVRLSVPGLAVEGVMHAKGNLASAPIVDPAGYLFVTREKQSGQLLPKRMTDLNTKPGGLGVLHQAFQ
ncbi:MAG: hypothetical protein IT375_31745 [Polyangiaceae bacterium]|nr:hypothetical protein [Polyangiaceae bacterium]